MSKHEQETDRTDYRYFIDDGSGVERETDMEGFISLERSCGFRPKPGCGPMATAGFSSGNRQGRIETPFPGPAKIFDSETGETTPAEDSASAYDRAREQNAAIGKRRYFAQRA